MPPAPDGENVSGGKPSVHDARPGVTPICDKIGIGQTMLPPGADVPHVVGTFVGIDESLSAKAAPIEAIEAKRKTAVFFIMIALTGSRR